MRILVLNWRDINNPQSGGAEILTHEMAKRWSAKGHEVTQISSSFSGAPREEILDGVRIVRLGRWWSIHVLTPFFYINNLRGKIDVIIDEVHWFPFFAALYERKKTVLLACEVANKLFFKLFSYPVSILGRLLEKIYFLTYRSIPTLAISTSTKNDLVQEGFDEKDITVLPMGINLPINLKKYPKEKQPTIIYLGRLNKQKGIKDAITAFEFIKREIPTSKLWVVGSSRLKPDTIQQDSIKFFGFVVEEDKFRLLAKAHILIVPSMHEGWGLIVKEAAFVGTPAVGYNVSGLKDTIQDGKTGFLVEESPVKLARATITLLQDRKLYEKISKTAQHEVGCYRWDDTARVALGVIEKIKGK